MATVTGFTAGRMKEIEDGTVVDGYINAAGELILQKYDGTEVNAGLVKGEKGDPGPNPDEVYALKTEVPSIEETVLAVPLVWAGVGDVYPATESGGRHAQIMVAQFPMRILQVSMTFGYSVAGDASNYYQFYLRRWRGAYDLGDYVSLWSANATAGYPRLEPVEVQPLNETHRNLNTNDLLAMTVNRTGTPAGNVSAAHLTIRYARSAV